MNKDRRLFYFTWAVAWIALGCGGLLLLPPVEAWFVTFPVAWTVALFVVRYQDRLRDFSSHPLMKIVYLVGIMSWHGWSFWERGVRKEHVGFKMVGILLAIMVIAALVTLIVGASQTWKSKAKSPNP